MGNFIDDFTRVAKNIATTAWGDGAAKGLMSTGQEMGRNVVMAKEASAATDIMLNLEKNGATFNKESLEQLTKSKFMKEDGSHMNRDDIMSAFENSMTESSRAQALNASGDAIKAYKESGEKLNKYIEGQGSESAAATYLGREGKGLGGFNMTKGYFGDAEHGWQRAKVAAGGTAATAVGMRYLQGGNITTTATGEKNIAGIPFV